MTESKAENLVHIQVDSIILEGSLEIPKGAKSLVLFAHGSGSSRFSPRNNFVAQILRQAKISTLLIDLLTEKEDEIYENRFNIDLLTDRLLAVTRWLKEQSQTKDLKIGYFGASTGAAAALKAAAKLSSKIGAIVSRGGRPDLAEDDLDRVEAPTLLIVGGNDYVVLDLNKNAYEKIRTVKEMAVIPGATHLFEERGALDEVAKLAKDWFLKYLQ